MTAYTPQLIVALDYADPIPALALARKLAPLRLWGKVGLELLMHAGPQVISDLHRLGLRVFLDGKFHDIPHTVAGAVRGATTTGATIINVHASGGLRMMRAAHEAAVETAEQLNIPRPLLIAVTVLTSISPVELLEEVGCARSPEEQVVTLAQLAREAGLDGVVASVWETAAIKLACGQEFKVITPGIRPAAGAADDQRRVATPRAARDAGADFLVVGRPITQAADPLSAAKAILQELQER